MRKTTIKCDHCGFECNENLIPNGFIRIDDISTISTFGQRLSRGEFCQIACLVEWAKANNVVTHIRETKTVSEKQQITKRQTMSDLLGGKNGK